MGRTKVLYYLERWSNGGIEAFICNVLASPLFRDGNIDAEIVAHRIEDSVFTERLKSAGVNFHELSGDVRSRSNEKLFRKLIKENRYDAVHFNVFHGLSFKMMKIAADEGVPVRIAHAHGAGLRKSRGRLFKLILSKFGKLLWGNAPTHRIACSAEAASFLFGKRDAKIIKNGIDTKHFAFSPEKRACIRKKMDYGNLFVLGHVGRFSEEKNQSFLIDLLEKISRQRNDMHLLLVGDGPLLPEVKRKAVKLGVYDKVTFFGPAADTESLLCAMDAFLFPSLSEGFGIAAIEAQCSGLPVVASNAVPKAALIRDDARAVPLADYDGWIEQILKLRESTADRAEGSVCVENAGYGIDGTVRDMINLYERGT